jgi:hypothetical protein
VPQIVIVFCWDIAEIVCIFARGGNRGIHPGAIVAIDLLAWLGWIIAAFFLGASGVTNRGYWWIDDYSGYDTDRYGYRYGSYDPSKASPEDVRLQNEIQGRGRALIAFVALIVFVCYPTGGVPGVLLTYCLPRIIHFALFVIGCYETNIRNRLPRTVYVMQPIYGAPQAVQGGYQQLGFVPAQPLPGQPLAPGQMVFMQVPPGQLPVQLPPAVTTETKTGADRLA